ncbi:hypothetical protein HM131_03135 [Halobacillus mangrovi]|uniref:Uncharacterized protein n=2 Tax=Halobacillus mangrovi TaxID=402384 RepID=A0A1W5ZRH6_9BACI|nr:hypothetical protein HM131_03135 [Halobacillus mangrovi]
MPTLEYERRGCVKKATDSSSFNYPSSYCELKTEKGDLKMNKISLLIFIFLSILFIANGLYQGLVNDSWQALIFGVIVIILGTYSFNKKKKKK